MMRVMATRRNFVSMSWLAQPKLRPRFRAQFYGLMAQAHQKPG